MDCDVTENKMKKSFSRAFFCKFIFILINLFFACNFIPVCCHNHNLPSTSSSFSFQCSPLKTLSTRAHTEEEEIMAEGS